MILPEQHSVAEKRSEKGQAGATARLDSKKAPPVEAVGALSFGPWRWDPTVGSIQGVLDQPRH
ncbi:hypothetical protein MPLSOD_40346 [Mesorhizobium sp. SOD10]|nr:hypothetical protein MPLSOD_40346 [Mesorhizobium sp. SOD10]